MAFYNKDAETARRMGIENYFNKAAAAMLDKVAHNLREEEAGQYLAEQAELARSINRNWMTLFEIYYWCFIAVLVFLVYCAIVSENFAKMLSLKAQELRINIFRAWLMIKLHPRNFITTWMIERKYRQTIKDIQNGNSSDGNDTP